MRLYKLTDHNSTTLNSTKWGEGVTHKVFETHTPRLCSNTVLHAYKSKELALLLNPTHADISDMQIWEAKGKVVISDWGKCGCFELTTIKQLNIPKWYSDTEQRKKVQVTFAILCAESVLHYFEEQYPDDKRPRKAIRAAKNYLAYAAAAAYDAAYAIGDAYDAAYAIGAARAAAYAIGAARAAAYAARAAAYAARAAAYAAYAAAAAYDADAARDTLDFNELAKQAVKKASCTKKA